MAFAPERLSRLSNGGKEVKPRDSLPYEDIPVRKKPDYDPAARNDHLQDTWHISNKNYGRILAHGRRVWNEGELSNRREMPKGHLGPIRKQDEQDELDRWLSVAKSSYVAPKGNSRVELDDSMNQFRRATGQGVTKPWPEKGVELDPFQDPLGHTGHGVTRTWPTRHWPDGQTYREGDLKKPTTMHHSVPSDMMVSWQVAQEYQAEQGQKTQDRNSHGGHGVPPLAVSNQYAEPSASRQSTYSPSDISDQYSDSHTEKGWKGHGGTHSRPVSQSTYYSDSAYSDEVYTEAKENSGPQNYNTESSRGKGQVVVHPGRASVSGYRPCQAEENSARKRVQQRTKALAEGHLTTTTRRIMQFQDPTPEGTPGRTGYEDHHVRHDVTTTLGDSLVGPGKTEGYTVLVTSKNPTRVSSKGTEVGSKPLSELDENEAFSRKWKQYTGFGPNKSIFYEDHRDNTHAGGLIPGNVEYRRHIYNYNKKGHTFNVKFDEGQAEEVSQLYFKEGERPETPPVFNSDGSVAAKSPLPMRNAEKTWREEDYFNRMSDKHNLKWHY